jgi:hypothetical protein
MNEAEEFSLLSNTAYQLEKGLSIDEIENELKFYELDYTIDRELSDDKSIVLKKDDKIIHSIRGTKPTEILDLLNDLRIGLGLQAGVNTLLSRPHLPPSLIEESKNSLLGRSRSGLGLHSIPDSQFLMKYIKEKMPVGYKRSIPKTINPEMRSFRQPKTPIEFIKSPYGAPLITAMAQKSVEKISNLILPSTLDRFSIEDSKFQKIKEKYPDKNIILTGHSLGGGIANYLGKKYNSPAITFNSAPNKYLPEKPPHPESKVYRTNTDPVSYLREAEDEKVINLPSTFYNSHSLSNFFPTQKQKITPPVSIPSFVSSTSKIKRVEKIKLETRDICKENPELPFCKNKLVFNV